MESHLRSSEEVIRGVRSNGIDPTKVEGGIALIEGSVQGWNADGKERRATMRSLLGQLSISEMCEDPDIGIATAHFLRSLIAVLRPKK